MVASFVFRLHGGREYPPFQSPSCGAVVASKLKSLVTEYYSKVSIPFIAGQWSLPERRLGTTQKVTRFNPLHCGAVVASERGFVESCGLDLFQSPSLRGSGRFLRATWSAPEIAAKFQSPSLRGSGRFALAVMLAFDDLVRVSIPFIAGQWSLLPAEIFSRGWLS